MKLNITTEPLSGEETDIILGAYDTAKAAHDAVMGDNWENARAEFRDLCLALAEWAAPEATVGYELMRGANDVLMARQRRLVDTLTRLLTDPNDTHTRAEAQAMVYWMNGKDASSARRDSHCTRRMK